MTNETEWRIEKPWNNGNQFILIHSVNFLWEIFKTKPHPPGSQNASYCHYVLCSI